MLQGENAHLSGVLSGRSQRMVNVLKYMFKPNSCCLPETCVSSATSVLRPMSLWLFLISVLHPIPSQSQILTAHHSKYPKSDHSSPTSARPSLVPGALHSHLDFCQFPPDPGSPAPASVPFQLILNTAPEESYKAKTHSE